VKTAAKRQRNSSVRVDLTPSYVSSRKARIACYYMEKSPIRQPVIDDPPKPETSFATRGSRVQIPSAPRFGLVLVGETSFLNSSVRWLWGSRTTGTPQFVDEIILLVCPVVVGQARGWRSDNAVLRPLRAAGLQEPDRPRVAAEHLAR
jgi:hypothetical protein